MKILEEQKKKYLSRRLIEIEQLRHFLRIEDFESVIGIGHRLKGNGETFGYPIISVIGKTLEKAALEKDKNTLLLAIEELAQNITEAIAQFNLKK